MKKLLIIGTIGMLLTLSGCHVVDVHGGMTLGYGHSRHDHHKERVYPQRHYQPRREQRRSSSSGRHYRY